GYTARHRLERPIRPTPALIERGQRPGSNSCRASPTRGERGEQRPGAAGVAALRARSYPKQTMVARPSRPSVAISAVRLAIRDSGLEKLNAAPPFGSPGERQHERDRW